MSKLRQDMIEDLQLAGRSERTQQVYVGAIRAVTQHYYAPHSLSIKDIHSLLPQIAQFGRQT